jgi:hypothetical protein
MKTARLTFYILSAAFIWAIVGCATQTPDPLAGWKPLFGRDYEKANEVIRGDYRDYIQKLPSEQRNNVGPIFLFEDVAGQHAAEFELGVNGKVWEHILIYDKNNKRIKTTIKYTNSGYRS